MTDWIVYEETPEGNYLKFNYKFVGIALLLLGFIIVGLIVFKS